MSKVFKVIGTLIKWYLQLTIGLWTLVGVGQACKKMKEYPELTPLEISELVADEAIKNYKNIFRR